MTPSVFDRALDLAVLPGYSRVGFALRGLSWDDAVARSLQGRTVLVTGGSAGLGEAACEGFATAGASVHMLVRDYDRGTQAVARIESRLPGARAQIQLEVCDITDIAEVHRFAESFLAREPRLDVLVNNAGALNQRREHTSDGIELTFATNVLGPFLLTGLLLPALTAAAPARVITVSSGGMYTARLHPDDPQLERSKFDGPRFYAHAKRAEVVLNRVWSEHHAADEIAFHAMHPGWAKTAGLRASLPRFERLLRPVLRDARQGADTIVWLGSTPSLEPASGGFWHDRSPRPEHRVRCTRDTAADRDRLWAECERLSALPPRPPATAPKA